MQAGGCDFAPFAGLAAATSASANGDDGAPVTAGKWGDGGWGRPGGVITWSLGAAGIDIDNFPFNDLSFDPDAFFGFDMAEVVREALAIWSAAANIEFVQVADDGLASGVGTMGDIRVFLGAHSGRNIIGRAYYPTPLTAQGGDVLIANDSRLKGLFDGEPDYLLYLLLHEIGHALGLPHSADPEAVMYAQVPVGSIKTELSGIDIGEIRERYGLQDNAPMVYELPEARAELALLHSPAPLTVIGNARDNRISGSAADETIEGGAGDDTLSGGGGTDALIGGSGLDRVEVAGEYAADRLDFAGGLTLDGDRLEGVEWVDFEDGILALDIEGAELGAIYRLYTAAFGRAADDGILFWQTRRLDGMQHDEIARAFAESPEFAERYGAEPEAFVAALFGNVLGRGADPAGEAFWLAAIEAGTPAHAMLSAFADSPENRAATDPLLAEGLFFADIIA